LIKTWTLIKKKIINPKGRLICQNWGIETKPQILVVFSRQSLNLASLTFQVMDDNRICPDIDEESHKSW